MVERPTADVPVVVRVLVQLGIWIMEIIGLKILLAPTALATAALIVNVGDKQRFV